MLLLATIIDWQALLETSVAALVAGVGVAFTFSIAILGSTRLAESSREHDPIHTVFFAALAVIGFVSTAAAIAFGLIVMTS